MMWIVVAILMGASVGLGKLAAPTSAGAAMTALLGAVVFLGCAWRVFERFLHMRFPTSEEHTVAARKTCWVLGPLLVIQVVLVLVGK